MILASAWDTSCCIDGNGGGVWWDRPQTQKATASNFGAALLSVRLFQRTNTSSQLQFATQVFDYWYEVMVNNQTGSVCDHIDAHTKQQVFHVSFFVHQRSLTPSDLQ
jgi:predicted alpha-1,6-mannanase (GH76 family)